MISLGPNAEKVFDMLTENLGVPVMTDEGQIAYETLHSFNCHLYQYLLNQMKVNNMSSTKHLTFTSKDLLGTIPMSQKGIYKLLERAHSQGTLEHFQKGGPGVSYIFKPNPTAKLSMELASQFKEFVDSPSVVTSFK